MHTPQTLTNPEMRTTNPGRMGFDLEERIRYSITWLLSERAFCWMSLNMDRIDVIAAKSGTKTPRRRARRRVFKLNEKGMERWRREERTRRKRT